MANNLYMARLWGRSFYVLASGYDSAAFKCREYYHELGYEWDEIVEPSEITFLASGEDLLGVVDER